MPFALAAFRKLLSGTLRSHGTPTDTACQVQVASGAPPVDAATAAAVRLTRLRSGGDAARASATVFADRNASCAVSLTATMTKKDDEESEDGADAVHHSNTYWVPVDVMLETIGVLVLNKSRSRAALRCLRTSLPPRCKCPQ